jgi:hypothetical protein
MAFKRVGNESHEWLREHPSKGGNTGKGRETRAEIDVPPDPSGTPVVI